MSKCWTFKHITKHLSFCYAPKYRSRGGGQAFILDTMSRCTGFECDEWNSRKNWIKHQLTPSKCGQIYFNQPIIIECDIIHSGHESRFYCLGKTDEKRKLFIVLTVRKDQIRDISARDMARKEREAYETLWKIQSQNLWTKTKNENSDIIMTPLNLLIGILQKRSPFQN